MKNGKTYTIGYIVSTYYPSPGATTPYEISRHMANLSHDVFVIGPRLEGQRHSEILDGILIHRVNVPGISVCLRNIVLAAKALIILLKNPPDIVHVTFSPLQFLLPFWGKLISRLKNTKWIFHMISVSVDQKPIRRFLQNKQSKLECHFFDAVITSNEYIKEKMLGKNWRRPVYLVPIGVNSNRFTNPDMTVVQKLRNHWQINSNHFILIYVGTFLGRNLQVLIHAFKKITETREDVRLFIVGEGEESTSLQQLVQDLNISNQVTFTGQVSYLEVPAYMKLSQVAISYIPKNDIYNIQPPLKTLEYLASGLPVVATNTIANQAVIRDKINGILVDDNETALFEGIMRLVSDDELIKHLASNATNSARDFTWDVSTKYKLVPAYRDILKR